MNPTEAPQKGAYDPEDQEGHSHIDLGPGHNAPAWKPYNPAGNDVASGDPSDPRGEGLDKVRGSEASPSVYNPDGDSSQASSQSARAGLNNAESGGWDTNLGAAAAGVGRIGAAKQLINFFWGSKTRRRNSVTGGVAGLAIAGGVVGLTLLSGPGQLIQLSHILQKNFDAQNSAVSNRLNKLLPNSLNAQDAGETRLSTLGRQFLRPALNNLKDIGIEFQTDSTGGLKGTTIDTAKLVKQVPELKGMTISEQQSFLAEKFSSVSPDQIKFQGNKFVIDASDFPMKSLSALSNDTLNLLADGKIVTAINERVLSSYFDLPSLFHPIKKASAAARKKLTTVAEEKQANADEVKSEITDPVQSKTAVLRQSLKDKLGGSFGNTVTKVLITSAVACTIRSAADDAVQFNHDAIEVPATEETVRDMAVGEQEESGNDLTIEQAGGVAAGFSDKTGTIWDGRAMQALTGEKQSGPDLSENIAQAFSSKTTADGIKKAVAINVPIVGNVTGALCSGPGLIVQGIAGLAFFIANIPDGGAGAFAKYAATQAATNAAIGGVTYFLEHEMVNLIKDNAIIPSVLSGPEGGNIMAWAGREAANMGGYAKGEVPLSAAESASIASAQQQQDEQQFRSESVFARVFDVNDYRSVAGRLADSMSPSLAQNAASAFSGLGSMWSGLLSNLSSIFMPHASAATTAYNWGFPQYGIPKTLLDDPNLADPYANGELVGKLLDAETSAGITTLTDKAMSCFGVSIAQDSNGQWNVTTQTLVDPHSQDYTDHNCTDLSDPNWRRVIMFIFDTRAMQALACFQGDDQSCQDAGYGVASGGSSTTTTASVGGFTNPFPKGWQPGRLDMGYDGTFSGQVVAPFAGTITYASVSFSNWGGYIELKADQKPGWSASSSTLYFAEGIKPAAGVGAGTHVNPGDPIGDAFTTGAQAGISGNIEWGVAQDGSVGSPTNTFVFGQCGSSSAQQSVLNFSQWAQQTLHVAPPASTDHAGCP